MGRRLAAGLTVGVVGIAVLAGCGDERATSETTAAPAVVIAGEADSDTSTPTSLAGVVPTTRGPEETTAVESVDTVVVGPGAGGRWIPYPGGTTDYVGPPLEHVLSRTTDSGIAVHAYAWPGGGTAWPTEGGPGWAPAPWCNPTGSLRVGTTFGDAIGVGGASTFSEPFGGISVQPLVAGYAEGTPFTVLVVQGGPDVDRVAATFADGSVDAAETTNGLALLATPFAPPHEEMVWTGDAPPSGPAYTLTVHRGDEATEIASADLPSPSQGDYEANCMAPTELPEPGEQPADPAAAEQAVRDAFSAVFDFADRAEGDRTWMEHLDSQEGVQEAIDVVLGGTFGSAAQGAEYTMGDLVFVSPTEAWFRYDLFANNNRFDDRFGLAVEVDGTWKISRGVICQDLALAGGRCEPPIGPLYPPGG
jgi:hypothetical protein